MSVRPASAITSASPIFWQVMPTAPASTCRLAKKGSLCVLMCGRSFTSAVSACACARAMLASARSRSIRTAGVSISSMAFGRVFISIPYRQARVVDLEHVHALLNAPEILKALRAARLGGRCGDHVDDGKQGEARRGGLVDIAVLERLEMDDRLGGPGERGVGRGDCNGRRAILLGDLHRLDDRAREA